MPGKKFDVSLVTPEGPAYEGEAEMIVVPGQAGEIGVLARHAPLIATLKAGSTRVYLDRESDDVREFATGPGFFHVQLDRAIALVDDAVAASEIDDARARRQLEEAHRGERFADHPRDVAGDPDLLNLTRPEVVLGIHRDYFAAGADIATTNTFTATSIGQADYALEPYVYEMNVAGAQLARQAADA